MSLMHSLRLEIGRWVKSLIFYTEIKESRMPNIGTAIKRIRQASDKGLAEVAKKAGISVPHLSQIESGSRNPSIEVVHRLGAALKIPAEALFIFSMPDTLKAKREDQGISALTQSLRKLTEAEASLKTEISKLGKRQK